MWELIRKNKRDSILLISFLGSVMILGGALIGMLSASYSVGSENHSDLINGAITGGTVAFFAWAFLTCWTLFFGSKTMLAFSRAKEAQRQEHPQLFNVVEEMAIASGMPVPKIFIINDTAPNAFATGINPESASIAVTRGLLMKLNRYELQGVIAHEMSHIKNRDILYMVVTSIMLGVIVLTCDFFMRRSMHLSTYGRRGRGKGGGVLQLVIMALMLLFALFAPLLARVIFFAVSRKREYLADACAAEMTRYPDALADALEKISSDNEVLEVANRATSALYICNPIKKFEARAKSMLSTHPPIDERVKILRAIGRGGNASFMAYNNAYKQLSSYRAKNIVPATAVQRHKQNIPVLTQAQRLSKGHRTQEQQMERLQDIQQLIFATTSITGMIICACGFEMQAANFALLKKMHEDTTGNCPGVVKCKGCGDRLADPADKEELNKDAKEIDLHMETQQQQEDLEHQQYLDAIEAAAKLDSDS